MLIDCETCDGWGRLLHPEPDQECPRCGGTGKLEVSDPPPALPAEDSKPPANTPLGYNLMAMDEFIGNLQHEHCSWDVPGGCDGTCDCHVEEIQRHWAGIRRYIKRRAGY